MVETWDTLLWFHVNVFHFICIWETFLVPTPYSFLRFSNHTCLNTVRKLFEAIWFWLIAIWFFPPTPIIASSLRQRILFCPVVSIHPNKVSHGNFDYIFCSSGEKDLLHFLHVLTSIWKNRYLNNQASYTYVKYICKLISNLLTSQRTKSTDEIAWFHSTTHANHIKIIFLIKSYNV